MYAKIRDETSTQTIEITPQKSPIAISPKIENLCNFSFSCYKIATKIQQDALVGKYYKSIFITKNENIVFDGIIDPDTYVGKMFNCHTLKVDPNLFIVHPTTFIRISNFWKFASYFSVDQINHPFNEEFESHIWGQWLVLNRIRVKEI